MSEERREWMELVATLRAELAVERHENQRWEGVCDELEAEVERLRGLLNRNDPVRCVACGDIRERSEKICGNCTHWLDGRDLEGGDSSEGERTAGETT